MAPGIPPVAGIPAQDPLADLRLTLAEMHRRLGREFQANPLVEPQIGIKESKFSYTYLLLPSPPHKDDCSVCLEETPSSLFCKFHAFHDSCIANALFSSSRDFHYRTKFYRDTANLKDQYGSLRKQISYRAIINEEALFSCPECRQIPVHSYIDILVRDNQNKEFKAKTIIQGRKIGRWADFFSSTFFDTFAVPFSLFQSALAHAQRRPELTALTNNIQQLFILGDLIFVIKNYLSLFNTFKEKFSNGQQKKALFYCTALATSACALTALSIYLNKSSTSGINLTEILSKMVSSDELKRVTVKFTLPLLQAFIHFVYANRIVTEFALAYFSPNRLSHLSCGLLQTFSLYRLSQLNWIKLERSLDDPLNSFSAYDKETNSPLSWYYGSSVKSMKSSMTFLLPCFRPPSTSCETKSIYIEAMMKSIYEYSTRIFNNSLWDRYIVVTKNQYGSTIGTSLKYSIHIVEKIKGVSTCQVSPYLYSLSASIVTSITRDWRYLGRYISSPSFSFS